MSFLPVARSSATLDYYYALQADNGDLLGDDRTEIVAMDLGLKETLFHEYLMEDAVYLLIAMIFISIAISWIRRKHLAFKKTPKSGPSKCLSL